MPDAEDNLYTPQILVIEDDPDLSALLLQKLQHDGLTARAALTGEAAIRLALENPNCLLLLDYQLPDMTGEDVVRALLEQGHNVPFIVMTAHGSEKLAVNMMKLGAKDYLVKEQGLVKTVPLVLRKVLEKLAMQQRLLETELALRSAEESLYNLIYQSADGILVVNFEGTIKYVNPAAETIFARSHQALVGQPFGVAMSAGASQEIEVQQPGGSATCEMRIVESEWESAPAFVVSIRDISARKRAERILQESERRFRELFENSPDAIFVEDFVGIVLDVNPAACRLQGLSREQLAGMSVYDLLPPEGRAEAEASFSKMVTGELDYLEGFTYTAKKQTIPIEIRTNRIEYQNKPALLLHVRDISERKHAQQELVASERKYRSLFNKIADPILIFERISHQILDCNESALRIYGYSLAELRKMTTFDLHPPEGMSSVERNIDKRNVKKPNTYTHVTKEGKRLAVEILTDEIEYQGREAWLSVVRDITERNRASEQLRLQSAALQSAANAIVITDRSGAIEWVNTAFTQLTGYNLNDIKGQNPRLFKSNMHDPDFYKAIWQTLLAGKVWHGEIINIRKDGSLYTEEMTITPVRDDRKKITHFVAVKQDITERRQDREQLRKAYEENDQLLASISSILIGVDQQGTITHWNAAAERTFGVQNKHVIGHPLAQCPVELPHLKVLKTFDKYRTRQSSDQPDFIPYARPGTRDGFLSFTIHPIRSEEGVEAGCLILADDITERKRLESQLIQAQKLESIGQLAAGVAHEINTPIQYVGDNTRFLLDAFEDLRKVLQKYGEVTKITMAGTVTSAQLTELEKLTEEVDLDYLLEESPVAIEQTLEGVQRVTEIVRAMKEFSHPGNEEKVLIDLNRALQSTITVARNEWKYVAEMETDLDPTLPPIACLPGEINQVFLNLIINAAHAIADVQQAKPNQKGMIKIETGQHAGWAEIRISDTGTGIPKGAQKNIFDPFFTTKAVGRGTGQGLAISHSVIVDKHGGSINFETEMGKGTTFVIRLPMNHS